LWIWVLLGLQLVLLTLASRTRLLPARSAAAFARRSLARRLFARRLLALGSLKLGSLALRLLTLHCSLRAVPGSGSSAARQLCPLTFAV